MDSRHLSYFREIVDSGSMTAAARKLGIAQPSLSQHVKNLEQHLGVDLLMRTTRGVVVTKAGQVLYDHAVRVMELLQTAEDQVRASGGEPYGRVVFGLPASVSMALSVPLAETVRVEMPKVSLCAVDAMSGHIKQWLREGQVDIGLLYDLDGLEDYRARAVLTEDLFFFSAPDSWPFESEPGEPVSLTDLRNLELILPSGRHGLRLMVERVTKAAHLSLNVVIEMDSLPQIKTLVARGSGYTILSPAAAHDLIETGTLVQAPIIDPVIRRPLYLVRSATTGTTSTSLAVERLCEDVIRDLVGRGIWQATLLGQGDVIAASDDIDSPSENDAVQVAATR